jgi:UDP-N-acetylmuramate--alanine ligase
MLELQAELVVVLNVELDHHATYSSLGELQEAYDELIAKADAAIVDWPEPEDLVLAGGEVDFRWRGHQVHLPVPGEHNAQNATAALEAARIAGAPEPDAAAALATFRGAGRRFERLGKGPGGAEVISDYAHHPTEVVKTIAAARTLGAARVIAVFQPHLFSRTAELHAEFSQALALADRSFVLDIYPARERGSDHPGVTAGLIAADSHPEDFAAARALLEAELGPGDVCLVMGAGDVDALARQIVA